MSESSSAGCSPGPAASGSYHKLQYPWTPTRSRLAGVPNFTTEGTPAGLTAEPAVHRNDVPNSRRGSGRPQPLSSPLGSR